MSRRPTATNTVSLAAHLRPLSEALGQRLRGRAVLRSGWPERAPDAQGGLACRGPGTWVTLGQRGSLAHALLWIEARLGAALVERALGGSLALGGNHALTAPSEAEEGVLAYLLADLAQRHGSGWVRALSGEPPHGYSAQVMVPLTVALGDGHASAFLLLDEAAAAALPWPIELCVATSCTPSLAAEVRRGDVLLASELVLAAGSRGLLGLARARGADTEQALAVQLNGDTVRACPTRPRVSSSGPGDAARMVLARLPSSALDAARLTAGQALTLPRWGDAELELGTEVRARGPLVQVHGRLGLLANEVPGEGPVALTGSESAARPEPPPD